MLTCYDLVFNMVSSYYLKKECRICVLVGGNSSSLKMTGTWRDGFKRVISNLSETFIVGLKLAVQYADI